MSAKRVDLLVVLGLAAATAGMCTPLLMRPLGVLPTTDIWNFYGYAAFDRYSILRYGQFPFRSPYHGGGYPIYTYPDDVSLSPRMALVLPFGAWAGLKLDYMLVMFLAAWGTYTLVRRQLGWPVSAAVLSAVVFAFGGFFPHRWMIGWPINVRVAVFPWIFYFWWRGRTDRRWLIPVGLIFGSLLLDGKYALSVLAWFMALWVLLRLDRDGGGRITEHLGWRDLGRLGALVAWAFPLAGLKLVPFVPLLWEHLQLAGQGQRVAWQSVALWGVVAGGLILAPMAARLQNRRRAVALTAAAVGGMVLAVLVWCPYDDSTPPEREVKLEEAWSGLTRVGEPEFFLYSDPPEGVSIETAPVGWVGLALALVAVVFRPRQVWRWAVLAGILLWIELDTAVPLALSRSVFRLPGLNVIRNTRSRYNLYLLFCLAVLAGRGSMAVVEWARARVARLVPWALAAASYALFLVEAYPLYQATVAHDLPDLGPEEPYHMITGGGVPEEHPAITMYQNVGVRDWELDFNDFRHRALERKSRLPHGPVEPTYRGEAYFWKDGSPGRVTITKFTPLEIRLAVEVKEPGILCLNQIRDGDWRTSEGAISHEVLTLGVRLTRLGSYEVRLRYVPTLFYWGVGVTVVSVAGGVVVILLKARPRRPRAA